LNSKAVEFEKLLELAKIKVDNITLEETPFIDKYEVRLMDGVKYSKLEKVLPELGMTLKAKACPIGYPVMERGIYRIEVQKVSLASTPYAELRSIRGEGYAPVSLGVDNCGMPFGIDLQTLPNLLIGGTPGAGKSMLLHSIILSLIEKNSKLYLVDPKMVEFNMYEDLRTVSGIEHSVKGVYGIINSVTEIMNNRFERLRDKGYRDVMSYNSNARTPMRPVVIVVDEWADIILQDKKIQKPLCVIAQKGRAAGISVILATQRPSSEVIPGLIKANFSGRIALRVASYRDSMIILDKKGAEKLRDVGTGLYMDHRRATPMLFRSPYIGNLAEAKKVSLDIYKEINPSVWKRLFG
jgi:DNA segregation ATPase FtsK/SpoIIIE, S-DNA-T family